MVMNTLENGRMAKEVDKGPTPTQMAQNTLVRSGTADFTGRGLSPGQRAGGGSMRQMK